MRTRSRTNPIIAVLLLIALAFIAVPRSAIAGDLDSAKQQLEKVKVDVSNSTWGSYQDDVKSTEDFLQGLPAADSAPVQKELDDLKAKAAPAFKEYKSKGVLDTAKRDLDSVADSIASDPGNSRDTIDRVNQLLNSDDAKTYADPDEVAKLKTRATSLMAMTTQKLLDQVAPIVKQYDDAMAAQPFKDAKTDEDVQHVMQDLSQYKSRIAGALSRLPATDPGVVTINTKLAAYDKTIAAAAGSAGASQAADQLANQWKAQQKYFTGWDKEPTGPSWDDYIHKQSEDMYNLNMPKTVEMLTRLRPWFQEDWIKTTAETYKDNASVKATMADAHHVYDTGAAKVDAALNRLLGEAEKIDTPKDELTRGKVDMLSNDVERWLQGTQYHDADIARAKKLKNKWEGAIAGGVAAKAATLAKMTTDATTAWPGISGGITAVDGFTPDKLDQFKGKIIHMKGNNRLGWDYEPGSYNFARAINGMPVAGKFDPNVAAAVANAVKQTGEDLPDEAWDVYATVEGPGKIDERLHTVGDVKVDGEKVGTVTTDGDKTVDCTVIKIFALHAGPVAVGPSGSASSVVGGSSGGSPVASASPGSASNFSIVVLLESLLCLAAGGLVVMKSRPALAAQIGQASHSPNLTSNDNIAMAGLAFVGLGILWLLAKLILGDLLPAAALMLAGFFLASDWLQSRGFLPPNLGKAIKPLGNIVAGAVVVFGILHLFLAHWYLF